MKRKILVALYNSINEILQKNDIKRELRYNLIRNKILIEPHQQALHINITSKEINDYNNLISEINKSDNTTILLENNKELMDKVQKENEQVGEYLNKEIDISLIKLDMNDIPVDTDKTFNLIFEYLI